MKPWEPWSEGSASRFDRMLTKAGITNAELAKLTHMHASTFSKWRSGERVPNADALAYMVALAHGSTDEVLGLNADVRAVALAAADAAERAARVLTGEAASLRKEAASISRTGVRVKRSAK